MNQWERLLPATPYPETPVLAWPPGEEPPALPAGRSGIAVWIRSRWSDSNYAVSKTVGVDGLPMWHGIGRMIVVCEPGEHLVEVRGARAESARAVTVESGRIAQLEFWLPISLLRTVDGVLVPAPARHRPGAGVRGAVLPLLLPALVWLGGTVVGSPPPDALMMVLLAAMIPEFIAWVLVKGRWDRRCRSAVSVEAAAPPRPAGFCGDGEPPPGWAGPGHGALVLTATSTVEYTLNGLRVGAHPERDRNTWLPWPTLTVDGERLPMGWRTWCYSLPAGRHELTVAVAAPDGADFPGGTATTTVDVPEGGAVRLGVRVAATVQAAGRPPHDPSPRALTGFAAEVSFRA